TAAALVPRAQMEPIDRLACAVTDAFTADVRTAYNRFDIHNVYLRAIDFESAMSSLYFDALKDPLYSRAAGDPRRRSAQSALLYVLQRFLTALAPILSFTTEEAWQSLPADLRRDAESVFDTTFESAQRGDFSPDDVALWDSLRALRARVAASESPRDFEAQVRLAVEPKLYQRLAALGDNLREALVVSQLELAEAATGAEDGVASFDIARADGEKCERCWKYRELGTDPENPTICADCAATVRGLGVA
ncbi:MAG: class I tRNA ligase family protein, partial [Candidatus Eremiobacteraeota bacterium]|nr:class I tRNA ligase family protein [Candidatus Eremiobacteraeota bacterium]